MFGIALRLLGVAAVVLLAESCAGEEGADGGRGPSGSDGPEGPEGNTGPQGQEGNTGPSCTVNKDTYILSCPDGSSIDLKNLVAQGSAGLTGPTGPQGPQGIQGNVGPQGIVNPSTCHVTYKDYSQLGGYYAPGYSEANYENNCAYNEFLMGGGCQVGATGTDGTYPAMVRSWSHPIPALGSPFTALPFSLAGAGWRCGATVMNSSATFYVNLWRICCDTP